MSRKENQCIAFQWKGEKIYIPNVVISSDLRRIADKVHSGRDASKVKNDEPGPELEWNPSWDDDDENDFSKKGVQHSAETKSHRDTDTPIMKKKRKGGKVQESDSLPNYEIKTSASEAQRDSTFKMKPYRKEKLFKNWMDQPNETGQQTENNSCNQCGIEITSSCSKCEACATKSENLSRTHRSSKTGAGTTSADFKCEECGKVFNKRIQLNMHAKIHARMEKSVSNEYSCTICTISFETNKELIRHQEITHKLVSEDEEDDDSLVCKKCNRVFKRENQLMIHKQMCKVIMKNSDAPSPVDQVSVRESKHHFKNDENAFICQKCDRVFERENQLKFHTKMCKVVKQNSVELSPAKRISGPASKTASRNQENTLTCHKCDREFERENQLKFHSKMCKAIKKDSIVPSTTDQTLKPTIRSDENKLACKMCDRIFERENQLKFHTKMCKAVRKDPVAPLATDQTRKPTIKSEENKLACKMCDRIFERENQLKIHSKMCKAVKHNPIVPSTSDQVPVPAIKKEDNELVCKKCDRVFERENQLKFHSKMCKAVKTNSAVPSITSQSTTKTEESELTCKKCDRIFERENQLKFHAKLCKAIKQNTPSPAVKDEISELACKQCDRVFERPNQLNFHSRLCKGIKYHPVGEPIKKEDCADPTESDLKPFIDSNNSLNEAVENLDKKFTCTDCGRKFDYEYEWKWHQRDHMKTCKNCGDKFHAAKFNEHLKSCFRPLIKTEATSSSTSNKASNFSQPVHCKTCGNAFVNSYQLSQHYLVHKFSVETFEDVDENYLQRIMPFACEIAGCGSRFSDRFDLAAHARKGLHNHKDVLGYSNPTYYSIRSNEVPPLNPYVLLKTKEKVAADVLLTRLIAAKSSFNNRSHRGRFREDIPIRSMYTCETCGQRFKIRQYYMIHISKHKSMEKYKCVKCNRRFPTQALYREHMDRHAADPNYVSSPGRRFRHDIPIQDVYNCETCSKSFTGSERTLYISHLNQHKKERFPCEKCDRKFEFESAYKTHVVLHDDPNYVCRPGRPFRQDIPIQDVYNCETCSRSFTGSERGLYIIHLNQHKKERFPCEKCERKFEFESAYRTHVKLHDDPNYVFTPGKRFRHDIPIQDVYNCETCSKSFTGSERTLYISHRNQHKKERYPCEKCDRKFEFESAYKNHVKLHDDPNYDPNRPGRRFRADIPIQKVYTCEICEKKFKKRQHFLVHTYAHNKEKFSCNLCDRKFISEGLLEAHLKRHEDPSYDPHRRPGRPFRYRDNVPIQDIYTCELCSKTFEDRSLFLNHLSAHGREDKYKCTKCGQKFQRAVLLEFHMKQHADPNFVPGKRGPKNNIPIQDVYTCEKCDNRQFTERQKYICHLNYHKFAARHNKFGKRKLRRSDIPLQSTYHCEKCNNREFSDRAKYILHLYWHSKGATFSGRGKAGRQPRSDIPVQDIYYCEQCNYQKSFTDRMKYILHIRHHNLERTHKCDGCLKVFKTVQTRDLHKEKFCKGVPCKYKCNQCSDRFHNKITLARHFQRYHSKSMKDPDTDIIEFPCNQCSQTFNTTFGLTRHIQLYHPVSSNIEMEVDVEDLAGENQDHGNGNDDNMSSHSWDAHDDEDPGLLAASLCQAELNEMPSLQKEEETSGGSVNVNTAKRRLPHGSTLCHCGMNKKYKTQKFCHSTRCACVQNGNRCSKNCDCDEGCLNSYEMEENQQQKFREGKESMMESEAILNYQHSGIEESTACAPILLGYNNENDDHYDEEPSTSSLSKLMPIPTSEFIAVDDGQDESIRQLTFEGYVEGAEDDDYDPLGDSESPQAAEPEIEFQTEQVSVSSRNPQSLLKPAIAQETRISDSQTPVIVSTSGSTGARKPSQPANPTTNSFSQTAKLLCQFCKKNFNIIPTYMSHILIHAAVENSPLTCPVCGKHIPGPISDYFEHLNDHNNGIDLQCTKCSSKFKTYGDMEKHLQIHHFRPMECGVCNIKFQNSQLMMGHWSKSHPTCQCGLCNVKYFSYDDLTFHMKSLHSPFDCTRCNERFSKHTELLDHFTKKHSTRTSNFQRNDQSKTSQFTFKCVYCGDTFSHQDDFNEHLSNHLSHQNNQNQSERYQCGQCNAKFTTSDDLHDHLAQHLSTNNWSHGELKTEEGYQEEVSNDNIQATEVFACPKCPKTFTHRSAWRGHLGSHDLLFCSACDSVFESRAEIRNHLKITSCKVFICDICDKNFNIKRYLGQHMRIVHGKDKGPGISNQTQNSLTPAAVANNMGFLTGRVTETEGGNVQVVLGGSSVPVIVASTSLARHGSLTAQGQHDVEEILLDSD